jgi:LysR family cyn operon transcriptional activator
MTMIDRRLRYVMVVADEGSFTRAAHILHVSQPALSQQIKQLEEELGIQLLDRTGRAIQATDAGKALIGRTRNALAELEAGVRAAKDVGDLSSGMLRLGFTPSFTTYLIGPIMQAYHARYPGIDLRLHESSQEDVEALLGDDLLDLGIGCSQVLSDDVDWEPLYTERLCLAIRTGHPALAGQHVFNAKDLSKLQMALLGQGFATRIAVNDYLRRAGVKPQIRAEVNSMSSLLELVQLTDLITILPDAMQPRQPGLEFKSLIPDLPSRSSILMVRRGAFQSAASLVFADMLKEHVKTLQRVR